MTMPAPTRPDLLQGTLDMMILKTLSHGANHGYGIARRIRQVSDEVLRVEEGSLYPALHRLEKRGYVKAEWRRTELNRRAKYYALTPRGRSQLKAETAQWEQVATAIGKVMSAERIRPAEVAR
jgi:PadR family transcriptional regulator, regulatory protein PadR